MLHYTDTKVGQVACVFLHYFGGSANTWQPVIDVLEDHYRCIAVDMLGFGQSPAPQKPSTIADHCEAVLQVLEPLNLKRIILVGHSMGGKVALAIAARQVVGLQKIMLVAPSPPIPEPMSSKDRWNLDAAWGNKKRVEKHLRSITAAELSNTLFQQTVSDNLAVNNFAWQAWLYIGSLENIESSMRTISGPITLVTGAVDKGLTTTYLNEVFKTIFGSITSYEIEDCGHLIPLEQPVQLADIILKSQ